MSQFRIAECSKVISAVLPQTLSAGTTYNGSSDASGIGIDTRDYNEALVIFHAGATSTNGTATVSIVESASDSTTASDYAAVSGAAFTQITTANDNAIYKASIDLKKRLRYLAVKSVVANQNFTGSVSIILSRGDSDPNATSVSFSV